MHILAIMLVRSHLYQSKINKTTSGDIFQQRWSMVDPTDNSISDVLDDLNNALDDESNEKLTELEFEELMEALDNPGLWRIKQIGFTNKEDW